MQHRTALVGVVLAALAATTAPAQATPAPTPATPASAQPDKTPRTITLVTGDQVTLRPFPNGQDQLSVKPGPGREKINFIHRRSQDGLSIVPSDAMPLLAAGRLDPRLFNVTQLAALGYDDAASPALPLIVTYPAGAAAPRLAGGRPLPAVNGVARSEPRDGAGALWKSLTEPAAAASGPEKIWLDGKARLSLDVSVPHIGASRAWEAGHTGEDVTVAVLDTGYDPGHADLKGLVTGSANFTAEADARDLHGHGTHVASTIAGSGAASGGRFKGVAPGAKLLIGKICDQSGTCQDSAIIEGMTWAAQHGARVANLSLGGPDLPGDDPVERALETLTEEYGTLFVVAAGNYGGNGPGSLTTPGVADRALTVGASFRDHDAVAAFSSTGPRAADAGVKPDLLAPGVGIVAARAEGTGRPVDDANPSYTTMDGTSMATPHVAGAAAIVAGLHPDWKADRIKAALTASTAPGAELGAYVQGAGRVDVARAVAQQVTTEPTTIGMGQIELPATSARRTLTYRNDGDAAVRLELSVTAKDGEGAAVTPFRLGATTLEVPAHGTAQVEVTAEAAAPGTYSGAVIATGGETSVRTAIGMRVVPEKRALGLAFTGTDGKPAQAAFAGVIDLDTTKQVNYDIADGALDLRLDKGHRYTVVTLMLDHDGTTVMAADPEFTLDADRVFASDARKAEPVDVRPQEPSARLAVGMLSLLQLVDCGVIPECRSPLGVDVDLTGLLGGDRLVGVKAVPTGRTVSKKFAFARWTQWARPKGDGTYDDSPYVYHLMKAEPRIPADPGYRPRRQDLAEVAATYGAQKDGMQGEQWALPALYGKDLPWQPYGMLSRFTLPFHRTEYYTPGDTGWLPTFIQYRQVPRDEWDNVDGAVFGQTTVHRAGRTTDRWNLGVVGVGLTVGGGYSYRQENRMEVSAGVIEDGRPDRVVISSPAQYKLYRDGKEMEELWYGLFDVPTEREEAGYRLTMTAGAAMTKPYTQVSAEWRFRSKSPEDGGQQALPLMVVTMNPDLDDRNRAGVGRMRIPLGIQRQDGSPDLKVTELTVEISYDDGRTWLPTRVHRSGKGSWTAETRHPASARGKFASLRVEAADTGGNAVTQTAIRAYEIS
ncbi:S8 family serine peptidase [Nonomuraea maritima]|uniref:S8 family serine peptidase n=1 Tax=Nonomuraea maritima TaxID=683260 RepID=UPI0037146FEC